MIPKKNKRMNFENLHKPSWNDIKWNSRINLLIFFLKNKSNDIHLIMFKLNNAMTCFEKISLRYVKKDGIITGNAP